MSIELINTGSELLTGRTLNTHVRWLGQKLMRIGMSLDRQISIPDRAEDIQMAVREALGRADDVVVTGGLGPTSDDRTRECIAGLLNLRLVTNDAVLTHIRSCFTTRNRPMPRNAAVQALVPEGARILPNPHGTAPGIRVDVTPNPFRLKPSRLWMMPGPPREFQPMIETHLLPDLAATSKGPRTHCRIVRTAGLGESMVEERLETSVKALIAQGLDIAFRTGLGEVEVRFSACGPGAEHLVDEAEKAATKQLGNHIYSLDDHDIETVVVKRLTDLGLTLAVAESCTGGLLSHRLTNIPGASAVLVAGIVCYSNASKTALLNVPESLLAKHGAVSKETAAAMVEGLLERTGADYGISITGIAGPSGGSPEKPVGTVYIGLRKSGGTTKVILKSNPFDRITFKQVTSHQALDLLRRQLAE